MPRLEDGFGFELAGGRGSSEGDVPLYVSCVYRNTLSTMLHVGDELLAVEGIKVEGYTLDQALALINKYSEEITLLLFSKVV